MKSAFKYFFLWLILMIVGATISVLLIMVIAKPGGIQTVDESALSSNPLFASIILLGSDLLPLFVFWIMRYTRFNFKFDYDFGQDFSARKLYLWAAIGCIGLLLWDLALGEFIQFPDWDTDGLEILGDMATNPVGIITICLSGPLLEEAVFRGAIERRLLEKDWNPWYAIVISALFFAVAHFNFTQGLSAFMMGCFIGWVYYRTRNLWPCVLIHALNNTIALVLMLLLEGTRFENAENMPLACSLIMLIAGPVLIYFAAKGINALTRDRIPLARPEEAIAVDTVDEAPYAGE